MKIKNTGNKTLTVIFTIFLLVSLSFIPAFSQQKEETKLYRQGITHCLKAEWKQARMNFSKLLDKYPRTSYTDARFWLGHAMIQMGDYQSGIDQLQKFANKYPLNNYAAQALFEVGEIYEKKFKQYDKALEAYNRVIRKYPANIASLSAAQNQANIYAQQKKDYKRALDKLKVSRALAEKQGISTRSSYMNRADQRIKFIEKNSDFNYKPLNLYSEGRNYEEKKRWYSAVHTYKSILEKYPSANISDDAHYRIINCYLEEGDIKKAKTECVKFIKKYRESPYTGKVKAILHNLNKKEGDIKNKLPIFFV